MGARAVENEEQLQHVGEVLTEQEATQYRALAAKANFLALDRPDIGYASNELCRAFARPGRGHVEALRKLVTYIVGKPRLA